MKRGISLISLIITIIVIIILSAIVIFTGINTPDRTNFARFTTEISDFGVAVQQDFFQKKAQYAAEGKLRSDAQIYSIIAAGEDTIANINVKPVGAVTVEELFTGKKMEPEMIKGIECYELVTDKNVLNWQNDKGYYQAREKEHHYITDEGEVFFIPGYRVEDGGRVRWYVNATKYYESETPIDGPSTIVVGSSAIRKESSAGEVVEESEKLTAGTEIFITFEAEYDGATVVLTSAKRNGTDIPSENIEKVENSIKSTYAIKTTKNGTYNFILEANGKEKLYVVVVNCYDVVTVGNVKTAGKFQVGDYVTLDLTGRKTVTLTESETGYSDTQIQEFTPTVTNWRIWDTDENGKVVLIPATTGTSTQTLTLKGDVGFEHSMEAIEKACSVYEIEGLTTVRSMKIEDLTSPRVSTQTHNNISTIVESASDYPGASKALWNPNGSSMTAEGYSTVIAHSKVTDETKLQIAYKFYTRIPNGRGGYEEVPGVDGVDGTMSQMTPRENLEYYTYSEEKNGIVKLTSSRWYNRTVTNTNYNNCGNTREGMNEIKFYDLVGNENGWLASPCVYVGSKNGTYVSFRVRYACASLVHNNNDLYYTNGDVHDYGRAVRPLVMPNDYLELATGTNVDTAGTESNPWVIIVD